MGVRDVGGLGPGAGEEEPDALDAPMIVDERLARRKMLPERDPVRLDDGGGSGSLGLPGVPAIGPLISTPISMRSEGMRTPPGRGGTSPSDSNGCNDGDGESGEEYPELFLPLFTPAGATGSMAAGDGILPLTLIKPGAGGRSPTGDSDGGVWLCGESEPGEPGRRAVGSERSCSRGARGELRPSPFDPPRENDPLLETGEFDRRDERGELPTNLRTKDIARKGGKTSRKRLVGAGLFPRHQDGALKRSWHVVRPEVWGTTA